MLDLSLLSTAHLRQILQLKTANTKIQGLDVEALIYAQPLPLKFNHYLKHQHQRARSFQAVFEIIGAMIDTWWAVVSVVSLALFVTIAAAVLATLLGLIYGYYAFLERKKTSKEIETSYRLAQLQLMCAKIILKREGISAKIPIETDTFTPPKFTVSKIKLTALFAFSSTLFFFSYFYGISSILECIGFLGAASLMTSPLGISLAGICGVGIACYFAYKYYHDKKNSTLMKAECTHLTMKVQEKREFIHALDLMIPLKVMPSQSNRFFMSPKPCQISNSDDSQNHKLQTNGFSGLSFGKIK